MIRIWPRPDLRRAFAEWAVAQRPKVPTVSPSEFGVPDELVPAIPELLLQGARLDGQPYATPDPAPAPELPADPPTESAPDSGQEEQVLPAPTAEPAPPAAKQEDQPRAAPPVSRGRGARKAREGR
ncbi:hypothetical protein ACIBEJ_00500 [Nonomuraea sp. NPDC050790]|uniref:hypothetical protein n=1 Tax=Nonomuraea sp. NPDC050790 TaxID=3364371 RepID=UPI0037B7965D